MSMNVPECFKFFIYTCRFVSKTITISTDDNDNDDDYNEGEEEEEEVKKPIKFDYNLKHSQAAPETFARQTCNFENAIC